MKLSVSGWEMTTTVICLPQPFLLEDQKKWPLGNGVFKFGWNWVKFEDSPDVFFQPVF